MTYIIKFKRPVQKFLVKHKNEKFIEEFYNKLKILSQDPKTDKLDIKKLKGSKQLYRLRIGKYRFLYEIIEDKLIIVFVSAGSRGEVYK